MASGQAAPAAKQMHTVVLKVSIHCHGCKKKVIKVLKSVEGVHKVTVDAGQHKVTVTGTVDAATLVERLYKSGKQALLLQPHGAPAKNPETAPAPPPATEAAAPAAAGDAGKDTSAAAAASASADKKPEEPVKKAEASEKKPEQGAAGGSESAEKKPEAEKGTESKKEEAAKPSVDAAKKDGGESGAVEPKAKADEPAKEAVTVAAAKNTGNDEGEVKKSKDKKPEDAAEAKKSKDKKPEDAGEAKPVVANMAERTLSAPPPKHVYEEYDHHYYPPQPVLSYHATQPRQSVSYYAPQPQGYSSMQQQQPQPQPGYSSVPHLQPSYSMQHPEPGYSYMPPPPRRAYSMEEPLPQHDDPANQWSPSYLYTPYPHSAPDHQSYYGSHAPPPPLQDSYRMFDDENPNACSVM